MSDRNHVHFSTKDSYDDEPELQMRSPIESYRHLDAAIGNHRPLGGRKESMGSPRMPSTRNSVRFQQGPTVGTPQISSPVIRDPTPYHHEAPLSEEEYSEEETEHTPRTKYPTQNWHVETTDQPTMERQPTVSTPAENVGERPSIETAPLNLQRSRSRRLTKTRKKEDVSDSDTLNGDDESSGKGKDEDLPAWKEDFVSPPVPAHLRRPEPVRTATPLRPALKQMNTEELEEGGLPHKRGVVDNLMSLYGMSRRKADPDDLTLSRDGTVIHEPETWRPRLRRIDSTASAMSNPLDPDHPLLTGVKRNTKGRGFAERIMHRTPSRGGATVVYHVASTFAGCLY
jgi:hypothetical protein